MAASYPTAAKTFTTKNAGDTIQPSHLNDLQDEVAAIESGLLNGTAPLNSSNSTVANLSVAGGSTLANLQAGNSTIAGTLTVTTIISTSITGTGATSYVRAYAGAQAEFGTASTQTKLALDQREVDLSSEYDSTTYTFTPKSTGIYAITARARVLSTALGNVYMGLWVNDTQVAQSVVNEGAAVTALSMEIATHLRLSSGAAGAIQLRAYAGSTGRMSSGYLTAMEILKVF